MLGAALQFLSGCAAQAMGVMRRGENAGYGASNVSARELEQVRVVDAANPDRWYFSQSGQPVGTYGNFVPAPDAKKNPGYGGNRYMSDTGHKVPEAILISWREMPPPGGQPYTGKLVGPFKILVRSKIPPNVLEQARRDNISLEFGFSAGEVPPYMQWRLEDGNVKSDSKGNPKVLAQGEG